MCDCVCIYVIVCICIYVIVCVYMCVYLYTHTHICITSFHYYVCDIFNSLQLYCPICNPSPT